MDEDEAVDALNRLGLTAYEARVFVALQKLTTGTASEVSEVADVPRSQVYGAAEGLERRGLVAVHQTTPTRYRPVPLEEAREKLLRELEADGERAFEYLRSVEGSHEGDEHRSDAVWTVADEAAIAARAADLIGASERRVIYGVDSPDQLEPAVVDALVERADAGVTVVAASDDPEALDRLADLEGVRALEAPGDQVPGTGRVLVADHDGVLLSVLGGDHLPEGASETAVWSADSAFAGVFVTLAEEWVEAHLESGGD
ncbi:MAG: helix-turn-helix domain-containing protein [Halobacteriales archaeon]